MSTPDTPTLLPTDSTPSGYTVGRTLVTPRPDEMAFSLTIDKYDLLMEGAVSGERQSRDVSLGVFVGSLMAILSLYGTDAWGHWVRWSVLLAIVLASGFCLFFFGWKVRGAKNSPGCLRVKKELDKHFGR